MKLCSNRPEGFSTSSHLSSHLPTTCFTDTILIPLPVWLYLALLPILLILSIHHRKQNFDPSTAHLRVQRSANWLRRTILGLYYVLIICNILMTTLEIVRLELIHFGIALLPFAYVGLVGGFALHWTRGLGGRIRGWWGANLLVWVGLMVMSVVKTVGLVKEGINGRKGSKYPVSDQVIDVAVIAGVYAIVALLEAALGIWDKRRRWRNGVEGK